MNVKGYTYNAIVTFCYVLLTFICSIVINNLWGSFNMFANPPMLNKVVVGGLILGGAILIIVGRKCIRKSSIRVNLVIKYHKHIICFGVILLCVFVFQNWDVSLPVKGSLLFEEFLWLYFLEWESNRIFPYSFQGECGEYHFYSEKPVAGHTILTRSQENARSQILTILDRRTSVESVNIALIGAWGTGKTSVLNTLIIDLQNRNDEKQKYFILKIDAQTIQGISNIIEYVRGYIYTLFKQYGIVGFGGKSSVAFITALADMLVHPEANTLIRTFGSENYSVFSDLESKRQVFSENIQKLLKRSHRKNIIFVIDDAERSEHKNQILKLLSEFTSVNGILSIVSLDNSYDRWIQPTDEGKPAESSQNENSDRKLSDSLDKYIHIRVRIEEENRIEQEASIKHQIINANRQIKNTKKGLCYIDCMNKNEANSLFDTGTDYGTNCIESAGSTIIYGEYNMLMELFHYNIEKYSEGESFGSYLEQIIRNYFVHCREFQNLITESGNEIAIYSISLSWFNVLSQDDFDWSQQIAGVVEQYFYKMHMILEYLETAEGKHDIKGKHINSFDEFHAMIMIKTFNFPLEKNSYIDSNSFNSDSNYLGIKWLLFSQRDIEELDEMFMEAKYDNIKKTFTSKMPGLVNLLLLTQVLADFIRYLRTTLNNYRLFKMQLREAELIGKYYLEYLVERWEPREPVKEHVGRLLERLPMEIIPNWPSLRSFLNMALYEEYITDHGGRFKDRPLEDCKAWILYEDDKKLLVVTAKENDMIIHFEFTTEGESVQTTETEKKEIEKIIEKYIKKK